jgi:predicted AAA+ superfamily ATPase
MKEILREIILDGQEAEFETGVPRHLQVTPVSGKATLCIGVRRSGKSTYMFQIMRIIGDRPRFSLF